MSTAHNDVKSNKRRRKEPGDSRAERKRELDRIAQRATRERTRNRIADLEQRLASLESGDKNGEIAQLTKTVGELRNENGRYQNALVKMRFAINEALGESEVSPRRDSTSTTTSQINGFDESRSNSMVAVPDESAIVEPSPTDTIVMSHHGFPGPGQAQRLQPLFEVQGYHRPPTLQQFGNFDLSSIYDFFEYGSGNPFSHTSPLTGRMPPPGGFLPIAPDEHKWKTSDDAFQQCLAAAPLIFDFDEGMLTRAILLGWESIGPAAHHPILATLQCVDQRVFGAWTARPQRLALMYICACAMRWRANPIEENRVKVPPWFLPRPAQDRISHPLVIDFLVWPGLRERLVFEYERYTVNGDFSHCFVEFFHFNWPYPDEHCAQYDQSGLICGLSKTFRDYVFDLKNWTMLPGFFARFPEMRADIDVWVGPAPIGY